MDKQLKKLLKDKVQAKKKKKSSLIALRLPNDIYLGVQAMITETGANQSQVIIEALRKGLEIPISS